MKAEKKLVDLLRNTLKHISVKCIRREQKELYNKMLNKMFLQFITAHKLEGKIDKEQMSNNDFQILDHSFFAYLEICEQNNRFMFEKQRQVLREIEDLFKLRGYKELPIVIKGVSLFGITNNHRNIKRSKDIDMIYSNPSVLESVLTDIGFKREGDDEISEHEYCMMVREDIIIDVHKFVPILNYSDGIINKSRKAEATNRRIFFESFTRIEKLNLLYPEIAKHSLVSDTLGEIPVPDVHYQILILCANIFRDYVNSHFHFSSGIILAELLDVIELLSHSAFDMEQLISISNNERRTSISFVGYLIGKIFDDHRLAPAIDFDMLYPKFLFWNGTMYLPAQLNEFIYFDSSDFVNFLDSENIDLSTNDTKSITPNIEKYNSHGSQHVKLVTLEKKENNLSIKITLMNKPIATAADVFEIAFEGKRCCFSFADNAVKIEEKVDGCKFGIIEENAGYSVFADLPIKAITAPWKNNAGVFICVTRWGDGPLSTAIPVSVNIPSAIN